MFSASEIRSYVKVALCKSKEQRQVPFYSKRLHHHKGNLYHVRIDISVPGDEIVVSREPHKDHSHEDAYVTIRDAFDAAKRQLDGYEQIQGP